MRTQAFLLSVVTLFLAFVSVAGKTPFPEVSGAENSDSLGTPTWEYRAVPFGNDEKETTRKLNDLSEDGWHQLGPLGNGMVSFRRQVWLTKITLAEIDASQAPLTGTALAEYLKKFGVQIGEVSAGTQINVVDARNLYEGKAVAPATSSNLLTQQGSNMPISFTLTLKAPVSSFGFSRPKLITTVDAGVSHPGWKAKAFDAQGRELDSAGEALFGSYQDVPAAVFALRGPGISSIRFESDNEDFAGFSAVLLCDFVLTRRPNANR